MAFWGRAWFRPRRYGFGATPSTWQGWALTIGFIALVASLSSLPLPADRKPAAIVLLIVLALFIVWAKTDGGWRWRWGDRD